MPRINKKEIKLRIIGDDSDICRASPYVLDLRKIETKEEKIKPVLKKRNFSFSFFKELSFVSPFYFLFPLLFRFFKKLAKLLKGFFVFFGTGIAIYFHKAVCQVKLLLVRSLKFSFFKHKFLDSQFSLPPGWQRAVAGFLVVSFILVLPFQALSYYGRFENFLIQNKLNKFNFNFTDVLKILSQKEGIKEAFLVSDIVKKILGYENKKRYLIIFQNSNEIRPTGGFIGSFALVDVWKGEIKNIEVPPQGSYALQGWLSENVLAPEPLHLVNHRWEFQDANWFPDFPASAKKIIWFYTKSGGPSVDGVIAITNGFFQKILEVIGPVEMPEYGKVINSENFALEIQKAVEKEYDKKENKPKQIITDLTPKIIEKILQSNSEQFIQLASVLNKALIEKDLLLYFKDKDIQNVILSLNWGGEIKETDGDYLMIVDTNIAGEKTDAVMNNKVHHLAQINDDGSIVVQVAITKTHQGIKGEPFSGVRNVDYFRIYVPKGSELVGAKGFESPPQDFFKIPEDYLAPDKDLSRIENQVGFDKESWTRVSEEFGKTVFGNWVQVDPGQTKTVSFIYRLPFKLSFEKQTKNRFDIIKENLGLAEKQTIFYSLFIQKQPGSIAEITSEVKFPYNWQPVWKYPENLQIEDAAWSIHEEMATDHFYGVVFEERL